MVSTVNLSSISYTNTATADLINQAQSPAASVAIAKAEADQVQISTAAQQRSDEEASATEISNYDVRVASSAGGRSSSTGMTREDAIALYREVASLL